MEMKQKTKTRKSNGEGSIYFDSKENRWRAEIQWSDKNGNKHKKKFSSRKSKSAVKNQLDQFRRQLLISNGEFESNSITFQEFAENWMTSVLIHKLKPSSYTRKEGTFINQVYPYIGSTPIDQITHSDIQDMVNSLNKNGLSYSTVKKAYEAVNGCLREYRIKTRTAFNPCEGITLPTSTQRDISDIVFFNQEQRDLIKEEATRKHSTGKPVYRLGHAIVVLMYTGMRIGELLALTWDDIDFDNKTININKNAVIAKIQEKDKSTYKLINQNSTKTKSGSRLIPMTKIAMASLKEIYKVTGEQKYVMSSSNGLQITPSNVNRVFRSILKQTNLYDENASHHGVHILRHTFASMLFQNGCDVKVVSEILGHSSTKITENIYIHIIQQQKVKAIQDIDKYSI